MDGWINGSMDRWINGSMDGLCAREGDCPAMACLMIACNVSIVDSRAAQPVQTPRTSCRQ
eukprot:15127-Chlamydomonas_euryale.AAC.4